MGAGFSSLAEPCHNLKSDLNRLSLRITQPPSTTPVVHEFHCDGAAVLANSSAGAHLDKLLAVLSPEILDAASVEAPRGVGRRRC